MKLIGDHETVIYFNNSGVQVEFILGTYSTKYTMVHQCL